jgi:hypothetical protein
LGGATTGETIFTFDFIEKKSLKICSFRTIKQRKPYLNVLKIGKKFIVRHTEPKKFEFTYNVKNQFFKVVTPGSRVGP